MPTETEWAYLASAIEMDGSMNLDCHNKHCLLRTPSLAVHQSNYSFLAALSEKFPGGYITTGEKGWNLIWSKTSVIKSILERVYPHLMLEKEVAAVLLVICMNTYPRGKGRLMTDEVRILRLKLERLFDIKVEELKKRALVAPEGMQLPPREEEEEEYAGPVV